MNERVRKLKERLQVEEYPICIEKARLIMEMYKKHEGDPPMLRRAKATAYYLDNRTIFIEDDELIVGNIAAKPMVMEAGTMGPTWPKEDIESLRAGGLDLSEEDEIFLRSLDDFWAGRGRTLDERQGLYYDDERLWPFIRSGILCPPWKVKTEGRGQGSAGVGWGLGLAYTLIIVDFAKVLNEGLNKIISDAKAELRKLRYFSADDIKKRDFLEAVIISLSSIVRIADRFGDLAEQMAASEKDVQRKNELLQIAEICRRVPGKPAQTFREAMQSFY